MTREEAIERMEMLRQQYEGAVLTTQAIDMAIEALSIPIMEYPQVDGITPHLVDEPNEDLVQRSDVLEIISEAQDGSGSTYKILQPIFEEVNGMPSCHRCYECDEALLKQVTSKLKNPCDSLLTEDSEDSKEQKSKLDLISRADAIDAVDRIKSTDNWQGAVIALLSALPSKGGDAEMRNDRTYTNAPYMQQTPSEDGSDLISRADAIDAIDDAIDADSPQWAILRTKIGFLPSAETTGALDEAIARYVADGYMLPPSADRQTIVRCKDCRYFKKIAERSDSGLCHRDIVASAWKENGYCSRGERKK